MYVVALLLVEGLWGASVVLECVVRVSSPWVRLSMCSFD